MEVTLDVFGMVMAVLPWAVTAGASFAMIWLRLQLVNLETKIMASTAALLAEAVKPMKERTEVIAQRVHKLGDEMNGKIGGFEVALAERGAGVTAAEFEAHMLRQDQRFASLDATLTRLAERLDRWHERGHDD